MLNKFITVLIIEISKFLQKNPKFFDESKDQRTKLLQEHKMPTSIKKYLESVSFDNFVSDLLSTLKFIKGEPTSIQNNVFCKQVAHFLCTNFANDIYSLPLEFFKLNYKEQQNAVNKFISSNSELAQALKQILTDNSYQEIISNIQDFASKTLKTPLVIIQSPIEISLEQKKEIREKIAQEQNSICMPIFQINKTLIGGLRIFINGKVQDFSWLGKINLITSLKI